MIQLSIIIVNYNGKSYVKECIDSINAGIDQIAYEIIVVDNASEDGSANFIRTRFPGVRLIANDTNRGFSIANNQGAAIAQGENLFFLNNDTRILEGDFTRVLKLIGSNRNIGIVGLRLINQDGTPQRQGSLLARPFWNSCRPVKVKFVIGAAIIMPRSLFEQLKGFDEEFGFYNEDLDLCLRARKQGYTIVYYPHIQVLHYGGAAKKYVSGFSIIEGYRGSIYLVKKHYPRYIVPLYKWATVAEIMVKLGCLRLRRYIDPERARVKEMSDAHRTALRMLICKTK